MNPLRSIQINNPVPTMQKFHTSKSSSYADLLQKLLANYIFITVFFLSISTLINADANVDNPAHCVIYADCLPPNHTNPTGCVNSTLPIQPNFTLPLCPQFNNRTTCCDYSQYSTFATRIMNAHAFFSSCPACWLNIVNFFCEFTCSPRQSDWLIVSASEPSVDPPNKIAVTNVTFNLDTRLAQDIYFSCTNVHLGNTGLRTLSQFGIYDYMEFYSFFGTASGGEFSSPIQMDFNYTNPNQVNSSLSYSTIFQDPYKCSDNRTGIGCSCLDCPSQQGCLNCPAVSNNTFSNYTFTTMGDNYLEPIHMSLVLGFLLYLALPLFIWRMSKLCSPPAVINNQNYDSYDVHDIHRSNFSNRTRTRGRSYTSRFISACDNRAVRRGVIACTIFLFLVIVFLIGTIIYMDAIAGTQTVSQYDVDGNIHVFSSYLHPGFFATLVVLCVALTLSAFLSIMFCLPSRRLNNDLATENVDTSSDDRTLSQKIFALTSRLVGNYPIAIIFCAIVFTGLSAIGLLRVEVETDPVKLWVDPDSPVMQQKNQFEHLFDPFYRTEQMIFSLPASANITDSIFDPRYLLAIQGLSYRVESFSVPNPDTGSPIFLNDLCYKPIPGKGCIIQSALQYFNDTTANPSPPPISPSTPLSTILSWIDHCAAQYVMPECRGWIGAPIYPNVVLGGYTGVEYVNATALVITYLLNNYPANQTAYESWEQGFLNIMSTSSPDLLNNNNSLVVHYLAENSIQNEIQRGADSDISTIIISYSVMLLYISLALGRFPLHRDASGRFSWGTFFSGTRFVLGLSAVIIVMCSLLISAGLVSACGVEATPIISEVIPFLVLAIGIDNVFIIFNAFSRTSPSASVEVRLYAMYSEVGNGIVLASISEVLAFVVGAQSNMPAVRAFAIYSAVALFADFILQIFVFTSILVLDDRRYSKGFYDILCCFRSDALEQERMESQFSESTSTIIANDNEAHVQDRNSSILTQRSSLLVSSGDSNQSKLPKGIPAHSPLDRFFGNAYLSFLLHPFVSALVVVLFGALFFAFLSHGLTYTQLGLSPQSVLLEDSYLQGYFKDQENLLMVGPPVYFVVNNHTSYNYSSIDFQDRICGRVGCSPSSLVNLVDISTCPPDAYITQSPMNWMDTYFLWVVTPTCCRFFNNGSYTPPSFPYPSDEATACVDLSNSTVAFQRPSPPFFEKYLEFWMAAEDAICDANCPYCSWGLSKELRLRSPNPVNSSYPVPDPNLNHTHAPVVTASRYMTYFIPMRSQADYINGIKTANSLVDQISVTESVDVFSYSIINLYYEEYTSIESTAGVSIGIAIAVIFVLCVLLLRSILASSIIVVTISMILGDLIGVMALWSIDLNSLSVLNLIMALGISVEFCVHLTVSFMHANQKSRYDRVRHAMLNIGGSVFSGITLTKFCGVIVLAFAKSPIFTIYYFRMYLAIVLIAAGHGLIFLPVILALIGPPPISNSQSWWSSLWAFDSPDNHPTQNEADPKSARLLSTPGSGTPPSHVPDDEDISEGPFLFSPRREVW